MVLQSESSEKQQNSGMNRTQPKVRTICHEDL